MRHEVYTPTLAECNEDEARSQEKEKLLNYLLDFDRGSMTVEDEEALIEDLEDRIEHDTPRAEGEEIVEELREQYGI
jgi:hypothetical protein